MKIIFKKIAIIAVSAMFMIYTATAQQGEKAAGGYLSLAVGDVVTNIGVGGKFQYNVLDPIRLEGSLSLFLPSKFTVNDGWFGSQSLYGTLSMWDISANVHYLINVSDQYNVYPLLGLSLLGATVKFLDVKDTETGIGLNIGGGMDFNINEQVAINGEIRGRFGEWSRFIISVGLIFKFN